MYSTYNTINPNKIPNKKVKILLWISISVTCLVAAFYYQNDYKYSNAVKLYDDGEYYKAGEIAESVISLIDDDTLEQIRFSKNVGENYTYYKSAMDYDVTLQMANYPDALTNLLQGLVSCNKYENEVKTEGEQKALKIFRKRYYNELNTVFGLSKEDVNNITLLNPEELKIKISDITSEIIEQKVHEIEEEEKRQNELDEELAKIEYNNANPIQITESDAYRDGDYIYCTGTVSNISNSSHSYVKVRITYYDGNGSVLTTDWTYVVGSEGIRAGENQQFEIMTKVNGILDRYKVEVQDFQ
jgi:hypothetical protein